MSKHSIARAVTKRLDQQTIFHGEVKKYVKQFRAIDGTFKRWGHMFWVNAPRTGSERPNTYTMLVLPWVFDADTWDHELIMAFNGLTDNFTGFPGEWRRYPDAVLNRSGWDQSCVPFYGVVLKDPSLGTLNVLIKKLWRQARSYEEFLVSLEPYRIRAGGSQSSKSE